MLWVVVMMTRLLALTLLLPLPLLACSSGGGDIPGPGCTSIQTSTDVTFSPPMAAGSGELTQCLGHAPSLSREGLVTCVALHATRAPASACACPADQGLQSVTAEHKNAIGKFLDSKTGTRVAASCVCEVKQLAASNAAELAACEQDGTNPVLDGAGQPINGYCYIDPENDPSSNPEIVSKCASSERRGIRFVGRPAVQQPDDISVELICVQESCPTPGE